LQRTDLGAKKEAQGKLIQYLRRRLEGGMPVVYPTEDTSQGPPLRPRELITKTQQKKILEGIRGGKSKR